MKSFAQRMVLVIAVCVPCTFVSRAQTPTGTINGTVTDASGAVAPGATVLVRDSATNSERSAESKADGHFEVPLLPPGTYLVTIEKVGFATVKSAI